MKKNVLCKKGDEITRFDGTHLIVKVKCPHSYFVHCQAESANVEIFLDVLINAKSHILEHDIH